MNNSNYLFIVNPTSGTSISKNSDSVVEEIQKIGNQYNASVEVMFTDHRGHATELVKQSLAKKKWKAIVAVGGDGTVNEVAKALVHTETPLGILPLGSGNGLARHLGIPLHLQKSLQRLFKGNATTIDSAELNDIPFFCTAGVGFDAYVGKLFGQQNTRGLATYMSVSFKSYWSFPPQTYKINGAASEVFSVTFANAGQYGNNAWIAPAASLQDGKLDVCTIQTFPKWFGISLVYRLFTKNLKNSSYISYQRASEVVVEAKDKILVHYDGEPLQLEDNRFTVRVIPASLQVIL